MATRSTRFSHPFFSRTPIALAALLAATATGAQTSTLPAVTVIGVSPTSEISVAGFGDTPLSRLPLQARVLSADQLKDKGVESLAEITRFDASVSDAYNAEGYWSNFTVRGFVIDPRYNYRRDGLPINAETSLPLGNKERVEILKGTSGMQAGTSAPGGLVNLVVKRPEGTIRSAALGWEQDNSWGGSVDLGQRFGAGDAFGIRLNAGYEQLDPQLHNAKGKRHFVAVAGDWRLTPDTLIEAEIESSHQSQPSQAGFSLLGDSVPTPGDPRINLNNQPWSQPVVLDGTTASLRFTQAIDANWKWSVHAATQQLQSDDRMAFPNGLYDPNTYLCSYCDRYAPDGSFTLWEFQSDGERRRADALKFELIGRKTIAGMEHSVAAGVLGTRFKSRFGTQIFDIAGIGNVDGTLVVPLSPGGTGSSTNRDEHSTELFARDAIRLTEGLTTWLGLRHTRTTRESILTNGSEPTGYTRSFTTPWLALGYTVRPGLLSYASWGQGIESEVAPNRARYTNAGQALAPLKSRQFEVGVKQQGDTFNWNLAGFDITRPRFGDMGTDCFTDTPGDTCTRQEDGKQHHRGLEADAEWKLGSVALQASAMLLKARLSGVASDPSLNGKRPVNVPERSLRLNARHELLSLQGLSLSAGLVYEGERTVLPDNSLSIPGWTRLDAGARFEHKLGGSGSTLVWRAGVDNLTDKRAWKEAPYQFGHVYLYPLAPRTFRLLVEASL